MACLDKFKQRTNFTSWDQQIKEGKELRNRDQDLALFWFFLKICLVFAFKAVQTFSLYPDSERLSGTILQKETNQINSDWVKNKIPLPER